MGQEQQLPQGHPQEQPQHKEAAAATTTAPPGAPGAGGHQQVRAECKDCVRGLCAAPYACQRLVHQVAADASLVLCLGVQCQHVRSDARC